MSEPEIAALRRDYTQNGLRRGELHADPLTQFRGWFADALTVQHEANAMSLATVSSAGEPSVRIVLMKGCDEQGLVFFTNYRSAKGTDLAANPQAALLFFWDKLERQVRLTGRVTKISAVESDEYFRGRPRGSQIGATASDQSGTVNSREDLEKTFRAVEEKFADADIPRPEHWGGYRFTPATWEFWQGRRSRLHDRFRYEQTADNQWKIERLAP